MDARNSKLQDRSENLEGSVGSVFRELTSSAKNLIQSEVWLAKVELKDAARHVGRHSAEAAAFGALLA